MHKYIFQVYLYYYFYNILQFIDINMGYILPTLPFARPCAKY